jgi:hypothetical protein
MNLTSIILLKHLLLLDYFFVFFYFVFIFRYLDPRLHNFENFWKSCHTTTSSTPPSSALSDDSPATSTISAFFQSDSNINKSNSYSDTDNDPYAEKQKNYGQNNYAKKYENIDKNYSNEKNEKNEKIDNNNEIILNKKEKRENPFREKKEIFRDLYEDGADDIGLSDKYSEKNVRKDGKNEKDEKGEKNEKEKENGEAVGTERAWSKIGARNKEKETVEKVASYSINDENEKKEKEVERENEIEKEKKEKEEEKAVLPRTGSSVDDLTRHNPFRKNGK